MLRRPRAPRPRGCGPVPQCEDGEREKEARAPAGPLVPPRLFPFFRQDKELFVTRRFLINTLKSALAFGLLGYVVYANWGYAEKVAAKVQVGEAPAGNDTARPTVTGRVISYAADSSLTLETSAAGRPVRFALVEGKTVIEPEGKSS